jgi:hypothetical protein
MSPVRFLAAIAIALSLAAGSAVAQNQSGRKPDLTAELIAKLRKPVDWARADKATMNDLVKQITDNFGVTVIVNEKAFERHGTDDLATLTIKVSPAKGMSLNSRLPTLLDQVDATFLVRKDHIEITPIAYAAKETENVDESPTGERRLAQPLVSMIFKEKPLNEALADLAEEYNLNVVVAPQSGDARTGFVSARLLNVPADKAIELLTHQNDLRVVRNGNTFMVTSKDQLNDLFNEKMDRERNIIEVQRLRFTPIQPPPPTPQIQVLPVTQVNVPAPNAPKP